jgi:hypothetical protein
LHSAGPIRQFRILNIGISAGSATKRETGCSFFKVKGRKALKKKEVRDPGEDSELPGELAFKFSRFSML